MHVNMIVVIVQLRSPIAHDGDNGNCSQMTDDRTGAADWLVCRFFDVPADTQIALDFTALRPVGRNDHARVSRRLLTRGRLPATRR